MLARQLFRLAAFGLTVSMPTRSKKEPAAVQQFLI